MLREGEEESVHRRHSSHNKKKKEGHCIQTIMIRMKLEEIVVRDCYKSLIK